MFVASITFCLAPELWVLTISLHADPQMFVESKETHNQQYSTNSNNNGLLPFFLVFTRRRAAETPRDLVDI